MMRFVVWVEGNDGNPAAVGPFRSQREAMAWDATTYPNEPEHLIAPLIAPGDETP